MADLTVFRDRQKKKGPPCSVEVVLAQLDDEQADQLKAALDDPQIRHVTIARVVTDDWDVKLTPAVVGNHRRGECSCDG